MSILHVNIASFAIQVERLMDPKLRQRPAVIAASQAPNAPLVCVSPEAHAMGIHKGMSRSEARDYDRRLIFLTPRPKLYQRAQKKIFQVVEKFTPVYEPMRLGSVFLDMDGMEWLLGKTADAASKLRETLRRALPLEPTLGIASNKLVSRVAAKVVRPQGLCEVFSGTETEFLDPLKVELLPGVERIVPKKIFRELGVRRIGDLSQVPLPLLTQLFGGNGEELYRKAHGWDYSEVRLPKAAPSLSAEKVFAEPDHDEGFLHLELWNLIESLGRALRERRWAAGYGTLEGMYVDQKRTTLGFLISPPTQSDFILFRHCQDRWKKFLPRRLRLKSMSLTLSKLQPEFGQLDLAGDEKEKRLLQTLDALRKKFGTQAVIACRGAIYGARAR